MSLIKKSEKAPLPFHHVRTQQKDLLRTRNQSLTKHRINQILDLSASRARKEIFLCLSFLVYVTYLLHPKKTKILMMLDNLFICYLYILFKETVVHIFSSSSKQITRGFFVLFCFYKLHLRVLYYTVEIRSLCQIYKLQIYFLKPQLVFSSSSQGLT